MGLIQRLLGVPEETEQRSLGPYFSISDPALAEYLGISVGSIAGVSVTDRSALGVTAFYRCVSIISSTIAGLPLKTYRQRGDAKEEINSWVDDPAGPYPLTPYAWKELVLVHMLTRGETFLQHVYNGAGAIIGLWPVHPSAVQVKWDGAGKAFKVNREDGTTDEFDDTDMTQVMGMSVDGLRGESPLSLFRHAIGLGIAGELAAGRTFGNGMTIAGIVTTADGVDVDEEEAKVIKAGLQAKLTGIENAGDIAFVNRSLKFTPWAMTNADAQFLESRAFQIEEFARMFGVPPHLLGQTEKQTSWGTGVSEQNLGLARYTLMGWTSRLEEAITQLLPRPQFVEFDYAGLLQGSPAQEIELLIKQVEAGLLTKDEARAIRNLPPLTAAQVAEMTPQLPAQESTDD